MRLVGSDIRGLIDLFSRNLFSSVFESRQRIVYLTLIFSLLEENLNSCTLSTLRTARFYSRGLFSCFWCSSIFVCC